MKLEIAVFGLSISSSWGNGHATTYRALLKALAARGHHVTFIERDQPWYRDNRDLPAPAYCDLALYESLAEVPARFGGLVDRADLVIVGSYVPDGIAIGDWAQMHTRGLTDFYDIDTPITLAALEAGTADYITPALIPRYDVYFSFTGGPALDILAKRYASPLPRSLYCSVDPDIHSPRPAMPKRWNLGYLGTYSPDRQPALEALLIEPARRLPGCRFVVAGPQYPDTIAWPANVERIDHLPPRAHSAFYAAQRFTLNLTRADMRALGYSPSVRLFEAAACATPVVSDPWPGIETFFEPGTEILLADDADHVTAIVSGTGEEESRRLGQAARARVLDSHTAAHRAAEIEAAVRDVRRRAQPLTDNRSGDRAAHA